MAKSLSVADRKKLYDRAGGECSFPECSMREPLEEAHIFARSNGGPRANPGMEQERRETYENFIILCSNHHGQADGPKTNYTVELLLKMKANHERDIAQRGERITEFTGSIHAEGSNADSVTGAKVTKPTRFGSGTAITAKGDNVRKVTGLEIGGEKE